MSRYIFVCLLILLSGISAAMAGDCVVEAGSARFMPYGGEKKDDGGVYFEHYGGVGDWFRFEGDGSKRSVTVVAKGEPSEWGYPLVQVLVETSQGEVVFEKKFRVYSSDYTDYTFSFAADKGGYFAVAFYLKGRWESNGKELTIKQVRVADAVLAGQTPEAVSIKSLTDESISKNRMGELVIKTRPGAKVKVRQTGHEFKFGTAIEAWMFKDAPGRYTEKDIARYKKICLENFNAVTPAVLYWHRTERVKNKPDFAMADKMYDWCEDNGLPIRGHCIFWGSNIKRRMMTWAHDTNDTELREMIKRRAREVTSRYKGRIKEYDLNNEMVHHRYFRNRLGDIVRDMAYSAKQGDPDAVLYVNDFNIFTNDALDEYAKSIKDLLDRGIPIGGIGIQGHLVGRVDFRHIWGALDTLAQFGLPLRITEIDIEVDDQQLKAKVLEEFYRVCFAHPAVVGITMWGFWESTHWIPKSALWQKDWTPWPAALAYQGLVHDEWRTKWEGFADDAGLCRIRAFYGSYVIEAEGRQQTVEFSKAEGWKQVEL